MGLVLLAAAAAVLLLCCCCVAAGYWYTRQSLLAAACWLPLVLLLPLRWCCYSKLHLCSKRTVTTMHIQRCRHGENSHAGNSFATVVSHIPLVHLYTCIAVAAYLYPCIPVYRGIGMQQQLYLSPPC